MLLTAIWNILSKLVPSSADGYLADRFGSIILAQFGKDDLIIKLQFLLLSFFVFGLDALILHLRKQQITLGHKPKSLFLCEALRLALGCSDNLKHLAAVIESAVLDRRN